MFKILGRKMLFECGVMGGIRIGGSRIGGKSIDAGRMRMARANALNKTVGWLKRISSIIHGQS
jgi:hypothetical protein